jgi:hypothetical protein
MLTTFGLVTFSRIFFRADNLSDAFYIIHHLFDNTESVRYAVALHGPAAVLSFYEPSEWLALAGALGVLFAVEKTQAHQAIGPLVARQPAPVRWVLYYGLVAGIALFGAFETVQFIYFQF